MLAEILNISLDPLYIRETEFSNLLNNNKNFKWRGRNYLEYDFFTNYFKNILDRVTESFGSYKDIILQYRQIHSPFVANTSHHLHKDAYRNSCIVIPFSNISDPVCFYVDEAFQGTTNRPKKLPYMVSLYSQNYAVLMDTQKYHHVMVIDKRSPRIFLQINYDKTFADLFDSLSMKKMESLFTKKI